jgi:hypothetical protein
VLNGDFEMAGLKYVAPEETKNFNLAQLPQGLVLMNYSGRDVVKLVSKNFDPKHGGPITVVYLSNGVTNQYNRYELEVERTGQDWSVMVNDQAGRRKVTRMFMKARKALGQIVGIEKITVN